MKQDMNDTFRIALRAMVVAAMTLLAGSTATAQSGPTVHGNVYGGGNAADVKVNTVVNIGGGNVQGNVYGGGKIGDVGTHEQKVGDNIGNYTWTDNTGVCNVNVTSGTIGPNGDTASDDDHGNVFGGGKGDNTTFWCEKAMVYSTNVTINNGTVKGSVFGGGEIGRVETNAVVKIGDGDGVAPGGTATSAPQIKGSVFGAGKGLKTHGYSALVRGNVTLTIEGNAKVYESVYGGGELASVGKHKVKTSNDPLTPTDAPADLPVGMPYTLDGTNVGECTVNIQGYAEITNNVFGAGQGVGAADYNYDSSFQRMGMNGWEGLSEEDYSTFLQTLALTTDTDVNIGGNAKVKKSVYGGSENGFVQFGTDVSIQGSCEIGVSGTTSEGNVYGGGRGISGNTIAGPVSGNSIVTINGGTTYGSVYGGGAYGVVKENVTVNVTGGEVKKDVYGGGALADTQTSNWNASANNGDGGWATGKTSASSTTTVRLTGGTILGEAYGGGLGEAGSPAYVFGDVLLDLNGTTTSGETGAAINNTAKGCVVGQIFGCNNVNGTPKGDVMVHVYATQNAEATQIANTPAVEASGDNPAVPEVTNAKVKGRYDVKDVYGGGNLAAYEPADPDNNKTEIVIDGCELTSIKQVYGGGNAACAPSTNVTVNGTFEVEELFGGGNGLDNIVINGVTKPNPGANVGYKNYSEYYYEDNTWKVRDMAAYDTKDERMAATDLVYGTGKASVNIYGGTVHRVFGGSNTKGNVRQTALTLLDDNEGCTFCVDEAYGGGKSAEMDAEAKLLMACIPGLEAVYGGAEAADVYDDVTLTITNGNFDRVFGGNNISGTIRGRIQVNIEETGCKPVIIGELYGGGNQAGYSVYGYNADGSLITSGDTPLYADPEVNVKSFTSIGNIYGGGYGTKATMVGNPIVNINEGEDATTDAQKHATAEYAEKAITLEANTENEHQVTLPKHTQGKMGAINNVFGGGNAAEVIGNTNVNIGTQTEGYMTVSDTDITVGTTDVSNLYTRTGTTTATYVYTQASGTAQDGVTYYKKYNVKGADIRGNVYGGGNNAQVTGNTNVNIGKKEGN